MEIGNGTIVIEIVQINIVFFGTGVTPVILKAAGTTPECRESFKILKTTEITEANHALNEQVNTGSTIEVAAFICETALPSEIKSSVENF